MRAFNKRNRPKHVTRGRYKVMWCSYEFTQRNMSKSISRTDLSYRTLLDEWVLVHYHKIAYYFKRIRR